MITESYTTEKISHKDIKTSNTKTHYDCTKPVPILNTTFDGKQPSVIT